MRLPHLPGLACRLVEGFHVIEAGEGVPVVFLHGNVSSATFWEEEMLALPPGLRAVAFDQRGYGETTAPAGVDARLGLAPFSADLDLVADALGLDRFHLVGHSMGGGVAMDYLIRRPDRVLTATLVSPVSPFGFCGTRDVDGSACWPDFAGSGGALTRPEFVERLAAGDRSDDGVTSPRTILRSAYGVAPFRPAREEILLSSMLLTRTGPDTYPGDSVPSPNWPYFAPGGRGINNALSPRFLDLSGLRPGPPLLWIHGDRDVIVSDTSLSDIAFRGRMGLHPGWPGPSVFPFQPMVGQIRSVVRRCGGAEVCLAGCGHTPYLERPAAFRAAWHPHLSVLSSPLA